MSWYPSYSPVPLANDNIGLTLSVFSLSRPLFSLLSLLCCSDAREALVGLGGKGGACVCVCVCGGGGFPIMLSTVDFMGALAMMMTT